MTQEFRVRRLRPEDDVQLEALYARTRNPYREEDAGAVAAMHCLALQARETGCRWSALPAEARNGSEASIARSGLRCRLRMECWRSSEQLAYESWATAASADADSVESGGLPSAEKWKQTADVGEVRRLRVLPEWRRRGVATALMSELISWSARARLRGLVLNTTAAQLPALALYRSLGFREIGRSYLDVYELVWMHLPH